MHTFPYCKEDRKIDVFGFKRWVFKAIVSTSLIHIVESHSASAPDQAFGKLAPEHGGVFRVRVKSMDHNLCFCVGLLLKLHHACANIFLATIKCNQRSAKIENTLLMFRRS
jgi:hypothetical protein